MLYFQQTVFLMFFIPISEGETVGNPVFFIGKAEITNIENIHSFFIQSVVDLCNEILRYPYPYHLHCHQQECG